MLKGQTPLNPNEEYVSYDVESVFTNILLMRQLTILLTKFIRKRSYHKYVVKRYSKDYCIN